MNFNNYQEKIVQASAYINFDMQFYCKFSINKVAEKFGIILKESVEVVDEDNFTPDSGKYYIIKSYGYGKERYRFYTDNLLYTKARIVLISAFGVIKEFGYTDETCTVNCELTFNPNMSTIDLRKLPILKFILEFNEDIMWRHFPEQKGNIFCKSVKTFLPQNKFYRDENPDINNFNYILPTMKFFGIIFDDLKDGYIKFRYIGGKDYEYKITEALNCIAVWIDYIQRVFFNPAYSDKNKKDLKNIVQQSRRILEAYESPEKFKQNYPDIKLTIDLDDNDQILKAKYVHFRDYIFNLLSASTITKGEINWDSELSKIQAKGMQGHIYEIKKWEFIDCPELVIEYAEDCNFFECKVHGSSLNRSNVYRYSQVKKSKLKDTYINRTCEVIDSFISGGLSTIDGKIVRGKIIGGRLGNHSQISPETELQDYTKIYTK